MSKPNRTCLSSRRSLDVVLDNVTSTGMATINEDKEAGTIEVTDDNESVCLRAIAKGKKGPWIVMYYNTERFNWK